MERDLFGSRSNSRTRLYEIGARDDFPSRGTQDLEGVGDWPVLQPLQAMNVECAQEAEEGDLLYMEGAEAPSCLRRFREGAPHGHPLDEIRYVPRQPLEDVIVD